MTSTTLVELLSETRRFRRRVAVSVLGPIATLQTAAGRAIAPNADARGESR